MILQSKRVWVLNEWMEAQVEISDGKIAAVHPYGTYAVDRDYGDRRVMQGCSEVYTNGA